MEINVGVNLCILMDQKLVVFLKSFLSLSSFGVKYAIMGRSPRCHIPSFVEIDLLVPGKKNFFKVCTIYVLGGHLI